MKEIQPVCDGQVPVLAHQQDGIVTAGPAVATTLKRPCPGGGDGLMEAASNSSLAAVCPNAAAPQEAISIQREMSRTINLEAPRPPRGRAPHLMWL